MLQIRYISEKKAPIHALSGIPWQSLRRATMKDIGRILREQRMAIGLEIGDIAKKTCICSRYLCAMEEGRFQSLPPVFDKGYLKIYADHLHADTKRLLASYEEAKKGLSVSLKIL
jgi:cytoskeletal protein RodZ